jgi:hypothetical protein
MQFYEFTHPAYGTDRAQQMANPLQTVDEVWLPGLICSVCGETWAGSRRLYLPVIEPNLLRRLGGLPLPEVEWRDLAQAVRKHVNLPEDFLLMPGDALGTPTIELLSTSISDFMHPFSGQIIARGSVINVLQRERLTGFNAIQVHAYWSSRIQKQNPSLQTPELYELLVTGHVWREGVDKEAITVCKHCGRTIFPSWRPITESRWDGSDFFNVDMNPNMVFVTEKTCQVLAENQITNFACVPV